MKNNLWFIDPVVVTAVLAVLLFMGAGCDSGEKMDLNRHPAIRRISSDSLCMGDTVIIEGSDFEKKSQYNRIVFSACNSENSLCQRETFPLSSSENQLMVRVPDGAFTGWVRVENINPVSGVWPGGIKSPPFPSNQLAVDVDLWPGDVGRVFYSGSRFDFTLSGGTGGREYLIILFNSKHPGGEDNAEVSYQLVMSSTGNGGKTAGLMDKGESKKTDKQEIRGNNGNCTGEGISPWRIRDWRRRRGTADINRQVEEILQKSVRDGKRDKSPPVTGTGPIARTRTFDVLDNVEGRIDDPANYTQVEADLMYQGSHTLLYVDQDTPSEYFNASDAEALGNYFDQSVYQTNHTYFGVESDINGDGKVAILLTPVVNSLTPPSSSSFIAGFFLPTDLLPSYVPSGATNGMEIFYSIVPDSRFPKEEIMPYIEGVLSHEFLHMIIFNYRILKYGNATYATYQEKLWLEESLAHIAENLNGHDEANAGRVNIFLSDPGGAHLVYEEDDALESRGAGFLFLRLLGDRYGNDIFREIVQSRNKGRGNVEAVTGQDFMELFADWGVSCYLSGLGISGDQRYNYTTVDFQTDFSDTLRVFPLSPPADERGGNVEYFSPEYIYVDLAPASTANFEVQSAGTGGMNMMVLRIE